MEVARLELVNQPPESTLNQIFGKACELSATAMKCERVGVWLFIDQRKTLRCSNLYELSKQEHSSAAVIQVADFPTYFSSLSIRKAVPAEVAATDPATVELADRYLKPLGISSILDAGIFVDSALVGVLCHEHVGEPREWTTEERDFAGSMADLVASRIQSAEMKELRATFFSHHEKMGATEKTPAMEQLTAGVAHDFRNLLSIFLGNGEQIFSRKDLPADIRAMARSIVAAAEKGIGLANELMQYARPEHQPPTVVDLALVTGNALPVIQSKLGDEIRLNFFGAEGMGQVFVEPNQFVRVLLNLAINASEAMAGSGAIGIKLTPVRVTNHPIYEGRYIQVDVIDSGAGMTDETRKRIFAPYFTTKSKGTGLGLAIVKQIVERANGFIKIRSKQGQGTTVSLFFPRIGASTGGTQLFTVPADLLQS
jgi:signal transduction histidine kinase